MKVHIIHSGSDGNSTILTDSNGNQILLDCGLKYTTIIPYLNIANLNAVLTTHLHLDHSKSMENFEKFGFDIYSPKNVQDGKLIDLENWKILPIKLTHNVECFGFMIYSKQEKKKILYFTDTCEIPEQIPLQTIDCWIQDTNYDENIVVDKVANGELINLGYKWHTSIQQIASYIERHQCKPKIFVAYHISNSGLNCVKKIENTIRPLVQQLIIAKPNTIIDF